MLKLAGKGFGGGATTILLGVASIKAATEFGQFGLMLCGFVVLGWTVKQLATSTAKNQAETASARAIEHLKKIEAADRAMALCEKCRENKVPVVCPLEPSERPQDCPRKDT